MAISLALGIDALFGDGPLCPHPVALFGTAMSAIEERLFADRRGAGSIYASAGVLAACAVGYVFDRLPGGSLAAGYVAVAGRGLWEAAADVDRALEDGDLEAARRLLPSLVGRDASMLGEDEIVRAVVESVAENTVDALVAPALFGAVAGATGALAYRAVNTLDSMVGYRDEHYRRFGWASARLDDVANYLPARATASLVVALRPGRARQVQRAVRREAPHHPSPNAGVAEAAFGAALGIRLGGTNWYRGQAEHRATAGASGGRKPERSDIKAAIRLSRQVAVLLAAVLALAGARGTSSKERER
jgi:adenosylcobinamide-phosphate synthase